jgi:hypothetical protein
VILSSQLPTPLPCILGSAPQSPAQTDYSLEANLVAFLSTRPGINAPGGFWPQFIDRSKPPGTWPAVVYEISDLDHDNTIKGTSGLASATVQLDCYSNLYPDVTRLAREIFGALDGFRGWMGSVAVWGVWFEDQDDGDEGPQDASGVWWYRRGLTYNIQYIEPKSSH